MRRSLLAISLSLLGTKALAASATWLLEYENKSTNELIWDKRYRALPAALLPKALVKSVSLGLGGPPNPVETAEGRYVSISACRMHSCEEKAFLWIDSKTGDGIGAAFDSTTKSLSLG